MNRKTLLLALTLGALGALGAVSSASLAKAPPKCEVENA